jgi:hypothetical protein
MIKKQILAFYLLRYQLYCSKDEPTSTPAIAFTRQKEKL